MLNRLLQLRAIIVSADALLQSWRSPRTISIRATAGEEYVEVAPLSVQAVVTAVLRLPAQAEVGNELGHSP